MKLYCANEDCRERCLEVTPDKGAGKPFYLAGSRMVCPKCLAKFKVAHKTAQRITREMQDDKTLNFLRGIFNGKVGP